MSSVALSRTGAVDGADAQLHCGSEAPPLSVTIFLMFQSFLSALRMGTLLRSLCGLPAGICAHCGTAGAAAPPDFDFPAAQADVATNPVASTRTGNAIALFISMIPLWILLLESDRQTRLLAKDAVFDARVARLRERFAPDEEADEAIRRRRQCLLGHFGHLQQDVFGARRHGDFDQHVRRSAVGMLDTRRRGFT